MKNLPKITEPDEGKIHYCAPDGLDAVTLCGLTDFIESTRGEVTDGEVNCWHCQRIVGHVLRHKKPLGGKNW